MEDIHTIKLLEFNIDEKNVILYRSFKNSVNDANFPIFTNKRLRYKYFNFYKAKRIMMAYTSIISNFDYDLIHRLKAMKKLYNYTLIFISDIFKYTSRFVLNGLYISIIRLMKELDNYETIINGSIYLKKLKKYVKCSMLKVINAIKSICIYNINILIRLPYSIFRTIVVNNDINIYKIDNGILLDKDIANALNNILKMNIIPIFIKKINIYIILYILKYVAFKEVSFCQTFSNIDAINNSGHLVIRDGNLIKIVI